MGKAFQILIVLIGCSFIHSVDIKQRLKRNVLSEKLRILENDPYAFIPQNAIEYEPVNRAILLAARCLKDIRKLEEAFAMFNNCTKKVDDTAPMCVAIPEHLKCVNPVISVLEGCLPEESKDLPQLGVRTFASVTRHICKMSGKSIVELLNPCLYEHLDKCLKEVIDKVVMHKHDPITKENVCSVAVTFGKCLHTETEMTCKNPQTRDAISGIFESLVEPCA